MTHGMAHAPRQFQDGPGQVGRGCGDGEGAG